MKVPISIIFGMYIGIYNNTNLSFKLWALEWAWHPAETNLRCAGSPRIYMAWIMVKDMSAIKGINTGYIGFIFEYTISINEPY